MGSVCRKSRDVGEDQPLVDVTGDEHHTSRPLAPPDAGSSRVFLWENKARVRGMNGGGRRTLSPPYGSCDTLGQKSAQRLTVGSGERCYHADSASGSCVRCTTESERADNGDLRLGARQGERPPRRWGARRGRGCSSGSDSGGDLGAGRAAAPPSPTTPPISASSGAVAEVASGPTLPSPALPAPLSPVSPGRSSGSEADGGSPQERSPRRAARDCRPLSPTHAELFMTRADAVADLELGETQRTSREPKAVKIIDQKRLELRHGNGVVRDQLKREVELAGELRHPNLLAVDGVRQTRTGEVIVVSELLVGGELFELCARRGRLTTTETAGLIRQLLEAVEYLHSRGIVHRDLKPENVLLSCASADARLVIIDFGSSSELGTDGHCRTLVGTLGYIAPEVLRAEPYSAAVDMWALGVITYVLLCGRFPFRQERHATAGAPEKYPTDSLVFPRDVCETARAFVRSLLRVAPDERPSATEARTHPFVRMSASCSDDEALVGVDALE